MKNSAIYLLEQTTVRASSAHASRRLDVPLPQPKSAPRPTVRFALPALKSSNVRGSRVLEFCEFSVLEFQF